VGYGYERHRRRALDGFLRDLGLYGLEVESNDVFTFLG